MAAYCFQMLSDNTVEEVGLYNSLSSLKPMLYIMSAHWSLRPVGNQGNADFNSEIKFEGGGVF